jgi:hypothetical protein
MIQRAARAPNDEGRHEAALLITGPGRGRDRETIIP